MRDYILKTNAITKVYGNKKAISNINMRIEKGDIYGLIGRNGSGKTTLLKTISGLCFPTSGEVILFGEKTNGQSDLLERVGVLIEAPGLYPGLTAYMNIKLKCISYGINKREYIESLLQQVGLVDVGKKKVKKFSLGMKQRLGIALALVGDPDLLLLDEPINGLDPQGIVEVRDVLLKLNKEKNITIIISSHILEELPKLVSRFGIINNGELIEEIDKDELLEKTKGRLEIKVDNIDLAMSILEENLNIKNIKVIDYSTIHVYESLEKASEVNKELSDHNVMVESLTINRESLEEYFIGLTGGEVHV